MVPCLQVHLEDGKLSIDQEGRSRKFTKKVQQKTFAASSANGREIMYVTERAVFKLREGQGLELTELAPGMASHMNEDDQGFSQVLRVDFTTNFVPEGYLDRLFISTSTAGLGYT